MKKRISKKDREEKYRIINDLYDKFSFLVYKTTVEAGWEDELNSIIVQLRYELKKF